MARFRIHVTSAVERGGFCGAPSSLQGCGGYAGKGAPLAWRALHAISHWALGLALLTGSGWVSAAGATPPVPVATSLRAYRQGFLAPLRLATDLGGRLYATDASTGRVTVRDEFGRFLGSHAAGSQPLGLAAGPDGRVYVGDGASGSVSIFLEDWTLLGKLGQGDGEFRMPNHIAIALDGSGSVFVVDSAANLVKVYEPSGRFILQFGGAGTASGQFDFPTGIYAAGNGEVYVADENNDRIQVFSAAGQYLRTIGRKGMGFGTTFGRIQGMTGDGLGRIYVADTLEGTVRVMDGAGNSLGRIGTFGDGPGQLNGPASVVVDRDNRLLVAATTGQRIELFGLDTFTDPRILPAMAEIRPSTMVRPGDEEDQEIGKDWKASREDRDEEMGRPRGHQRRWRLRAPVRVVLKVPGLPPDQILPGSIRVQGFSPLDAPPPQIQDFDGDGQPELRVWLNRLLLLSKLPDGLSSLVIQGEATGGRIFEGLVTVTVVPEEEEADSARGRTPRPVGTMGSRKGMR